MIMFELIFREASEKQMNSTICVKQSRSKKRYEFHLKRFLRSSGRKKVRVSFVVDIV